MTRNVLETLFVPLGIALRNRRSGRTNALLSRPGWAAPETIAVASDSFPADGEIADRYSAASRGPNVSPHLRWSGAPSEAKQFVLVVEDLDSPMSGPGIHTIGIAPPQLTELAEGEMTTAHPDLRWVPTRDGRRRGYSGPRPLPGHGPHRYVFHVFALDAPIPDDAAPADLSELEPFVSGHVLAHGSVTGHQTG